MTESETAHPMSVVPDDTPVAMPPSAPPPTEAAIILNDDAAGGPAPIPHTEVLEKIADEVARSAPDLMPPTSWSKEHWPTFAGLPREVQEYVLENEEERNRSIKKRLDEAARLQKSAEEEAARITKMRAALVAALKDWRHGTVAMVALFTGMRLGEVLAL